MSAPPIAGLHPQFQVLTPQAGYFNAQSIDFRQQPRNQRSPIRACGSRVQRCEQHAVHDSCVVRSGRPEGKDLVASQIPSQNGFGGCLPSNMAVEAL